MKIMVSASEAARSFSELLNRVHYRGESFVIARGGKPVGELVPTATGRFTMSDLAELLRPLPRPDDEYLSVTEELIATQPKVAKSPWPR